MSDYFQLFGLPVQFAVDEVLLKERYFAAQRKTHPDRSAGVEAAQKAAEINQAYQTLKNPVKRAEYLLTLSGKPTEKPSQALLMEAMEQREALAEATDLAALKTQNETAIAETLAQLNTELLPQAVLRLIYLTKFSEEIRLKAKEVA